MAKATNRTFLQTLNLTLDKKMYDPTFLKRFGSRKGAVLPLFALLLPVLFLLSGFAINLAYMQLCSTEMKVATDATAHAAGRTMSEWQRRATKENIPTAQRKQKIIDETYKAVGRMTKENLVGGREVSIALNDSNVEFGVSRQAANHGLYQFSSIPVEDILSSDDRASSVGVTASVDLPLAFQAMRGITNFNPSRRSVATQVDRDIALVLDRSGSMLHYQDEDYLDDIMDTLYNTFEEKRRLRWNSFFRFWYYEYYWDRRISNGDRNRAKVHSSESIYDRDISADVVNEMLQWIQEEDNSQANVQVYEYVRDWRNFRNTRTNFDQAPDFSRWHMLSLGVEAFLDVLGGKVDNSEPGTDQKELVSLVTFNSNATVDLSLTDDDTTAGGVRFYGNVRELVADVVPEGGTGIGRGLETGLPPIVDPDYASTNGVPGASARPFAAKTVVILTDGENTAGEDPGTVVRRVVEGNSVTIHTVTFSSGANQTPMQDVAEVGGGSHFHADEGDGLVQIFEEIANNLPTILTE